jgi:hypothetical protein
MVDDELNKQKDKNREWNSNYEKNVCALVWVLKAGRDNVYIYTQSVGLELGCFLGRWVKPLKVKILAL